MNFQEHFQKHPELVSNKTIGQIQTRPRTNTPKNHAELKRIANLCHIPNADRNSFTKLSDLLGKMADRIGWAMDIKTKGWLLVILFDTRVIQPTKSPPSPTTFPSVSKRTEAPSIQEGCIRFNRLRPISNYEMGFLFVIH